ncbi:hypothetical protein [Cetobacterium sp.]|uniref:hypothetical protein n=1 Tax=Cetobacterium sp. TaxID=2071632 RepID=UPI003EE676D5
MKMKVALFAMKKIQSLNIFPEKITIETKKEKEHKFSKIIQHMKLDVCENFKEKKKKELLKSSFIKSMEKAIKKYEQLYEGEDE